MSVHLLKRIRGQRVALPSADVEIGPPFWCTLGPCDAQTPSRYPPPCAEGISIAMASEVGPRRAEACKLNASGAGATGERSEARPMRLVLIGRRCSIAATTRNRAGSRAH